MSTSDTVRAMMALAGKSQVAMAEYFGISKQALNNKLSLNRWPTNDLAKACEFCGAKLEIVMDNGQRLSVEPDTKKDPDA